MEEVFSDVELEESSTEESESEVESRHLVPEKKDDRGETEPSVMTGALLKKSTRCTKGIHPNAARLPQSVLMWWPN